MKNKLLIAAVIILLLALVIETGYLVRSKSQKQIRQPFPFDTQYDPFEPTLLSADQKGRDRFRRFDPDFDSWDTFDTWDPFEEMERMQTRINRLFRESLGRTMLGSGLGFPRHTMQFEPDMDVSETATHYIIKADLPGLEKDKINIDIKNGYLTLSGERKIEREEDAQGFYKRERSYGSFSRSVPLPSDANAEDVTADYSEGVITITIGKLEPTTQKGESTRIPIS